MLRTISCGEVRKDHIGSRVELAGWVDRRRDHGNLIFIDLRDREGLVQVVFNPETAPEQHAVAERLRSEWVVQVGGLVRARPEGAENPKLATGAIEVAAETLEVLNESRTPPFEVGGDAEVDELLRLKHRYVDLRRAPMRDMLALRHRVVKFIRDFLDERGFLEVETPILIKSTPEGARDYIVPSRLYPGKFYALPQSPQQLKQLLMAGGVDKYFQIARCFRDEDPRADRQPEHTQLDLEMSFVEQDDVLDLIEELYTALVKTVYPEKRLLTPFPRLTYADSMADYGTDKPDLRFGLKMADLSETAGKTDFRVFRSVLDGGGIVKGFAAPGCARLRQGADRRAGRLRQEQGRRRTRAHRPAGRGRLPGRPDRGGCPLAGDALPRPRHGEGDIPPDGREQGRPHPGHSRAGQADQRRPERPAQRDWPAPGAVRPGPLRVRLRHGLPSIRVEGGRGPVGRDAPRLLHAQARAPRPDRERPRQGDRADLRPYLQRLRVGQRQHPRAPPRATGAHPEGVGLHARPDPGTVRPATDGLRVRRSPARRHRAGHRPTAHGPDGEPQHPRHDRLPQDAERDRPAVRGSRARSSGPS